MKFKQSHLSSPAVAPLIDAAKIFYVEGYFLPYGIDSVMELSKKVSEKGKVGRSMYVASGCELTWTISPDLRP